MKGSSEIFYCYSPNFKKELLDKGERYIAKGLHPKTNRFYWMFYRTKTLQEYLDKRLKSKR